jgi:hypothetical protein
MNSTVSASIRLLVSVALSAALPACSRPSEQRSDRTEPTPVAEPQSTPVAEHGTRSESGSHSRSWFSGEWEVAAIFMLGRWCGVGRWAEPGQCQGEVGYRIWRIEHRDPDFRITVSVTKPDQTTEYRMADGVSDGNRYRVDGRQIELSSGHDRWTMAVSDDGKTMAYEMVGTGRRMILKRND